MQNTLTWQCWDLFCEHLAVLFCNWFIIIHLVKLINNKENKEKHWQKDALHYNYDAPNISDITKLNEMAIPTAHNKGIGWSIISTWK